MNPTLARAMRARVRVSRRLAVEDLGDGRVRLTCQTCGHAWTEIAGSKTKGPGKKAHTEGSWQAKKLAAWWAQGDGRITGTCAKCLKRERDEKWPINQ